jgi:hypothetical protein
MSQEKPKQPDGMISRPDNLVKALFGIDYKGLTEDERTMQKLLIERFKKSGRSVGREIMNWRKAHSDGSYGDAVRAIFEAEEKAEREE